MTAPLLVDVGRHRLDQSQVWTPRDISTTVAVADMTPAWRLNVLLMLLADAAALAARYEAHRTHVQPPGVCIPNPQAWIVGTPIFRALAATLPAKRSRLVALDEQARHQPSCFGHDGCDCDPRPATDRTILATITAARAEAITP